MFQENAIVLDDDECIETPSPRNEQPNKEKIVYLDVSFNSNQRKNEIALTDSPSSKSTIKTDATKNEEFKIRIGSEFQAVCPSLIPINERNLESLAEKALKIWIPKVDVPDAMIESYISFAHKKFGYNIEQALAMLYWHKFDTQKATEDLRNFVPFPDEWTREDKVIFEDALLFHGKNFHRLHEFLPDKTVGGLIDYYYRWKKRRGRQRLVDRRGRPRAEKKEQPTQMDLYD